MKKTLLMFVSLVLTTMSALALPTKPEVKTFIPLVSAAKGYLYNVEAGMFITNGSWWGTNACGADNGLGDGNGSNDYTFEAVRLGTAKLSGNLFEVGEVDKVDGDPTEYFCLQNLTKSGEKEVYLVFDGFKNNNETDIWIDGANDRPYDRWHIVKNADNTFKLMYADSIAGFKKFDEGNIHVFMNAAETPYTTWALVSEAVYKEVIDGLNLYYVADKLSELVAKAKAQGISKDFSGYEALLASDTTTYNSYTKANATLNPLVGLGDSIVAAKALDAARDWSSFEAIYADDNATTAQIDSAFTNLKSVMALKKGILSAEAGHNWSSFETIYNTKTSTTAELDSALTNLNAYKSLKAKLDNATKEYPNLDFSAAKAVYDATGSTNEKLAAAEAQIDKIIADYNQSQATLENPADITATIPYVTDLAAIADANKGLPTAGWTSTKKEGDFHVNTWSVEGNPGNDGTNMTTPFLEYWKGKGNNLDDQIFYRDPERDEFTVLPGAYRISSNIRLYNESGADYMTGAYLFGNLNRTNLVKPGVESQNNAIDGAVYGTYNSMLYYWKDSFETYAIVPADGTLKFGVQTEGANFNWVATKNWKVEYLGAAYESLDYVRKNSELRADSYDDETIAQKSLLAEYNAAVGNYKNATTAEAISEGYAGITALMDSVMGNVAAYKAYVERLDYVREYMGDAGSTLEGDYVDLLSDYIMEDNNDGPSEDYPNGTADYIMSERNLSTSGIKAELAFLNTLFDNAIKYGLVDGSDLTNLIVNPGFEQPGGAGWSWDKSLKEPNNWHGGGVNNNYNAEAYQMNFDIYQIIEDVPNGLYEVSVQAFYRTGTNDAAWNAYQNDPKMQGEAKVYPEVYLNEFATKVRNTMEVQFSEPIGTDSWATPAGTYTLNGVNSAAAAFGLEDPEQNFTMSAYGLVTDGKIRLGIRKLDGPTDSQQWTLWDNFKLTYRAKNETALKSVIESIMDQYSDYIADNGDYINDLEYGKASNAIDAASEVSGGDADELYEALNALNAAYVGTQAHVAAMMALEAAVNEITDALNEYSETATDEAIEKAADVAEEAEDIDNLTTEEIIDLTERIKDAIPALKIPKSANEASDDNPVEMTDLIVNADIEAGVNEGWSHSGATAIGQKSPGIETISFEFWAGSAADAAKNLQFDVWQTLAALPAGKYELQAELINSLNKQKDLGNPGRAFLYAATFTTDNDTTQYSTAVDVTGQNEDGTYKEDANVLSEDAKVYSVIFTVEEGQKVRIGVKTSGVMTARWFIGDNFKLWYYGTESEKEDSEDPSGVEAIEAAGAEIVAIYTVSGAQVSALQQGINIVKYADGTTKKVIIK